jgi:hypothetical protein
MPVIAAAASASSSPKGAVVPIASFTQTDASNTNFTNIPSIYQDLYIQVSSNTQQPGSIADYLYMGFNGSGAGNYSVTRLTTGTSVATDRTSNGDGLYLGIRPAFLSNLYGGTTIHILNYASTTAFKPALAFTATENGGSGTVQMSTGTWRSTSAITSILFGGTGNYPGVGTTFTLYGVRGMGQ